MRPLCIVVVVLAVAGCSTGSDPPAKRAFNASLPCRADLVGMKGGGHAHHVLATFQLRRGPGGKCSGFTRVRYTIENGKFTEWRQLPDIEEKPA
jgi:hypothetical protein